MSSKVLKNNLQALPGSIIFCFHSSHHVRALARFVASPEQSSAYNVERAVPKGCRLGLLCLWIVLSKAAIRASGGKYHTFSSQWNPEADCKIQDHSRLKWRRIGHVNQSSCDLERLPGQHCRHSSNRAKSVKLACANNQSHSHCNGA
jgi:hypothetical protein